MYEITLHTEFCAAHSISIEGEQETLHGHNFRVQATVAGPVDDDGLVCDFHIVEHCLESVLEPFNNRNLNEVPPFDRRNPTAENIAEHIASSLTDRLTGTLPPGVHVSAVSVSESPGCVATYRPTNSPEKHEQISTPAAHEVNEQR